MKVVPALLTKTIDEFSFQLNRLLPFYQHFSIDIQDGKFVPSTTISIPELINFFTHSAALNSNICFDLDLMVKDYKQALDEILRLSNNINIRTIFLHIQELDKKPLPSNFNIPIGLAFDPPDKIEETSQFYNLKSLSAIQIMTIYSGPQGQSLIAKLLKKLGELRQLGYRNKIYVDGGVNNNSLPVILKQEYKPDFLCVGSYLSKAENVEEHVKELHSIINM